MKRRFEKMHGLGNDFVIVDARASPLAMTAAIAKSIADRRRGVGCDQLILLEPSEHADLRMRIWNSDGSEVGACGNATRCVVQLTGANRIESAGGLLESQKLGEDIEVVLAPPRFGWDEIPLAYAVDSSSLPLAWNGLDHPFAVNVGNPHVVFFVADTRDVDLEHLGPMIESDPIFPQRVNVNIASIVGERIKLRTYERGAGETLACGTGACASAIAAISTHRAHSPVDVDMSGGTLTIEWSPGKAARMRGPSTHVFSGELDLDVLQ